MRRRPVPRDTTNGLRRAREVSGPHRIGRVQQHANGAFGDVARRRDDVRSTVEIGASGIDVVAGANALWVPTRSAAVDPTGFPTMLALRKVVAATGAVTTRATSVGRLDVHGLQYRGGRVWLADNRTGTLFRLTG